MEEDFDDLDPAWSIALYRIAQEALTNVVRHARAKSVRVQLLREPEGMRLRIVDDGVGMRLSIFRQDPNPTAWWVCASACVKSVVSSASARTAAARGP